ncbi:OFA family MFS transporter [Photobacterium sp. OFAV2-7]|uniref:L-lactate MFS transporter n=1 Tax=Photobacterium sp. OFAV2-7 TaxID=2917748 RepID=UPI001EF3E4E3|nr:OFA family MFS transporter [Photobacterium sp. OFAV2-7]MCG7586630.1 OFA family MFS transporter [Photobacterium sp. OFAV2-7]
MDFKNKAVRVLLASCGVNLCIGILYAWSVFKNALVVESGWTNAQASFPYTISIIVLSLALLAAGFIQDRIGPRKVLMAGTLLAGTGLILSSFTLSPLLLNITFGVITGCGIGFGYACLNPATMKWFHSSKKGLVNGLLATAFGIASVYLAPLVTFLIETYGISHSFLVLGCALIAIAFPLACTIDNPPAGYTPADTLQQGISSKEKGLLQDSGPSTVSVSSAASQDIPWHQMLKQREFYMLWVMFAFASAAGLMVIANITSIAANQANITSASYLVVALALFNSGGRLAAGVLSDYLGGVRTLTLAFCLQGINMFLFAGYDSNILMLVGAALAGVGYGALLAVFPSIMASFYGLKHYGANYGVLYTAWGVGGFIGPVLAAIAVDYFGEYDVAYYACGGLMLVAIGLSLRLQPIKGKPIQSTHVAKSL